MNKFSWEDVTVEEYQKLYKLGTVGVGDELADYKVVAILLHNEDVDELMHNTKHLEMRRLIKEAHNLLSSPIEGQPVNNFIANGRKYAWNYRAETLDTHQFREVQHFLKGELVDNLHLLAASVVNYHGKRGIIWNSAKKHKEVSEDMKKARIVDLYHSAVFFYQVLMNYITRTLDCSGKKLAKTTKVLLQKLMTDLMNTTGGCFPLNRLQSLKE